MVSTTSNGDVPAAALKDLKLVDKPNGDVKAANGNGKSKGNGNEKVNGEEEDDDDDEEEEGGGGGATGGRKAQVRRCIRCWEADLVPIMPWSTDVDAKKKKKKKKCMYSIPVQHKPFFR